MQLPADARVLWSLVVPQAFPGICDDEVSAVATTAAARHGFTSMEITAMESDAQIARTVSEIDGLATVLLAGLPLLRAGVSLSDAGESRSEAIRVSRRAVDAAASMGATAVMVTSGRNVPAAEHPAATDRFVDSLVELGDYATGQGVQLRLEPTDTEVEHKQLLGSTRMAVELVQRVAKQGPIIDLNLDLSHLLQLGEDPATALALAVDHCRHFHLANCVISSPELELYGDRHPPFGYPGSEVAKPELRAVLGALHSAGYFEGSKSTTVGIEVIPPAGSDPWEVLDTAVGEVGAAWEAVCATGGPTLRPAGERRSERSFST